MKSVIFQSILTQLVSLVKVSGLLSIHFYTDLVVCCMPQFSA